MIESDKQTFSIHMFCRTAVALLTIAILSGCNGQSQKETVKFVDTASKVAPESLHFTAHITINNPDGSKAKFDTITRYEKHYYSNGKLQMEGKVTKANPKDYRDGIWKYYNEEEQLMNQETYTREGKINQREFTYFINGKPMSETYQYYEGDFKDKATFKFHKIEKLFYTNGQELSERHSINAQEVDLKCWDSKGNPKPIEYLKTIKSVEADE
jgi:antitoxin component YwqK of YwqJK toxin-antitoxin module